MSTTTNTDTIYAHSSGSLPSGVAIIRVSGPSVDAVIEHMVDVPLEPRNAALCAIRNPHDGELLDEGLVLFFPSPNSFTGEDIVELQCHGGVATVDAILKALGSIPGLRVAERGEFSRRALENGRLDITELEGLSDLVAAQTDAQRKLALAQSSGSLRKLYDDWRSQLIKARAFIEAELDFADEDDVPGSVSAQVRDQIIVLRKTISDHLQDNRSGELIRSGFRIALLGAPNAGKSSLLNALAKRDVAIVTPQAGTTRDVIEVSLGIRDHLVIVSDTAGMRNASDLVEQEGIRRAHRAAGEADLVLWLQASDDPVEKPNDLEALVVRTKIDLESRQSKIVLGIHTLTSDGIIPLLDRIEIEISSRIRDVEEPVLTRQRHREALENTVSNLVEAEKPMEIEHRSEHLRRAADALGRITGRIDVEDLLDTIFSEFCIGK